MNYKNDAIKALADKFVEIDDQFIGTTNGCNCYRVRIFDWTDSAAIISVEQVCRGSLRAFLADTRGEKFIVKISYVTDNIGRCNYTLAKVIRNIGSIDRDDVPDILLERATEF